jgi:hypothetical protein
MMGRAWGVGLGTALPRRGTADRQPHASLGATCRQLLNNISTLPVLPRSRTKPTHPLTSVVSYSYGIPHGRRPCRATPQGALQPSHQRPDSGQREPTRRLHKRQVYSHSPPFPAGFLTDAATRQPQAQSVGRLAQLENQRVDRQHIQPRAQRHPRCWQR